MQVCVGALLCQDNAILLGKRSASRASYPDVWDVPGGHREDGESLEEALVRELREELGVTPTVWQKLAVVPEHDKANDIFELYLYVVTAWDGAPCILQFEEHDHIAWFTVEEACRHPRTARAGETSIVR